MTLDFSIVLAQWPLLLKGLALTCLLTLLTAPLGVALGVLCAWLRVHGPAWLRAGVAAYVELVRNTPFII